ncbi:glycosyltransferase [Microbacterium sp. CR_7]|uniref:glycosyltransferase n=1 Tax=Microbacterium sp. CR_7 TaxID=3055792 RepID=UPI0035C02106
MPERPSVSVCMATYNGSRFVREQIDSILAQLHEHDELLVIDDESTDGTADLVEDIGDRRIVVHRNARNLGYVRTFERALTLARNEVLVLSDQDDVWIDGRLDALVDATASHAVVASNLLLLESHAPLRSPITGRPWLLRSRDAARRMRNEARILLGDAPYFGCTMALRRDALDLVLPFPDHLDESHDLWIATVANASAVLGHLEQPTLLRRVHSDNASTPRPRGVRAALRSRLLLLRLWREARRRRSSLRSR